MTKIYASVAVVLFWVALSASLLRVQLAASPVYKMRVPTYRTASMRSTVIAQAQAVTAADAYKRF